jgi:hypothetical protein
MCSCSLNVAFCSFACSRSLCSCSREAVNGWELANRHLFSGFVSKSSFFPQSLYEFHFMYHIKRLQHSSARFTAIFVMISLYYCDLLYTFCFVYPASHEVKNTSRWSSVQRRMEKPTNSMEKVKARVFRRDSPSTRSRRGTDGGGESSSMLTSVEGNAVQGRVLL